MPSRLVHSWRAARVQSERRLHLSRGTAQLIRQQKRGMFCELEIETLGVHTWCYRRTMTTRVGLANRNVFRPLGRLTRSLGRTRTYRCAGCLTLVRFPSRVERCLGRLVRSATRPTSRRRDVLHARDVPLAARGWWIGQCWLLCLPGCCCAPRPVPFPHG